MSPYMQSHLYSLADIKQNDTFQIDSTSGYLLKLAIYECLEDCDLKFRFAYLSWIEDSIQEFRCKVGLDGSASEEELAYAKGIFGEENILLSEEGKIGIIHEKLRNSIIAEKKELKAGFLQACAGGSFYIYHEKKEEKSILHIQGTSRSSKNKAMFPIHPLVNVFFTFASDKKYNKHDREFERDAQTLAYNLTRSQPKAFFKDTMYQLSAMVADIAASAGFTLTVRLSLDRYSFKYEKEFNTFFTLSPSDQKHILKNKMLTTIYIAAGTRSRGVKRDNSQWTTHCGFETTIKYIFAEAKKLNISLDLDSIPAEYAKDNSASALILAANNGYTATVNLLLNHKADVNYSDEKKMTSLGYAVRNDDLEMVKLLLSRGAHLIVSNDTGNTALHFATSPEMVTLLLEQKNIESNAVNKSGETALHFAINLGYMELIKRLIESKNGCDPNLLDKYNRSPLYYAVLKQNIQIVEYLLSHIKNPNDRDQKNTSPLALAVSKNNVTIIKMLLTDSRIDINDCNNIFKKIQGKRKKFPVLNSTKHSVSSTKGLVFLSRQDHHFSSKQQIAELLNDYIQKNTFRKTA